MSDVHDPMGVPRVPIDVRMRIGTKFSGIPQELRSITFRSGPSGGIPQERTTLLFTPGTVHVPHMLLTHVHLSLSTYLHNGS